MARGRALLDHFDRFSPLRKAIGNLAEFHEEWAGIPMPLSDPNNLVIEPTWPRAKELMAALTPELPEDEEDDRYKTAKIRNIFWASSKRRDVYIYEIDGKIEWGTGLTVHHARHELYTMGASDAWGIEQEANAVQLLGTLLPHHTFKRYILTGMFLETSKRSQITYMFRKLRPTLALSGRTETMKILCALCCHPIGYYDGSWAGAMTPTDDVVAMLMMMRGDEHLMWRRSNQHPPYKPEAGLG